MTGLAHSATRTVSSSAVVTTGGPLDDGNYSLTVLADQIADGFGQALDGDGDGQPGGNLVIAFHRLFGDFDGNKSVNFSDFLAFRSAFGNPNAGPVFDSNNDGAVNFTDFLAFRSRFGTMLP